MKVKSQKKTKMIELGKFVATEGINCDNAETVGENIQKPLDNLTTEEAKISKQDQIKTLDTLHVKTAYIDPLILIYAFGSNHSKRRMYY